MKKLVILVALCVHGYIGAAAEEKLRILIVDDSPLEIKLLQKILEKTYDVTYASSLQEAQELLSAQSFDAMITDNDMPEHNQGVALIAWVRGEKFIPGLFNADMPIIAQSGRADVADSMLAAGANLFYTKPLKNIKEVVIKLSELIKHNQLLRIPSPFESEKTSEPSSMATSPQATTPR